MNVNLSALAGVSLLRALLWRKLTAENDLSEGTELAMVPKIRSASVANRAAVRAIKSDGDVDLI
jgi:hypothetical protein